MERFSKLNINNNSSSLNQYTCLPFRWLVNIRSKRMFVNWLSYASSVEETLHLFYRSLFYYKMEISSYSKIQRVNTGLKKKDKIIPLPNFPIELLLRSVSDASLWFDVSRIDSLDCLNVHLQSMFILHISIVQSTVSSHLLVGIAII